MGLRQYLRNEADPSPLRKSLRDQGGIRALVKAQRRTHDETTWGYYDHDDPGEEAGAAANAHAIVDQGPKVARPHRPGYHADGYRKPVEKSAKGEREEKAKKAKKHKRKIDPTYQNPDGTFKGGFDGAVKYFMHDKGYSKEVATKIAGKIAAEKGK